MPAMNVTSISDRLFAKSTRNLTSKLCKDLDANVKKIASIQGVLFGQAKPDSKQIAELARALADYLRIARKILNDAIEEDPRKAHQVLGDVSSHMTFVDEALYFSDDDKVFTKLVDDVNALGKKAEDLSDDLRFKKYDKKIGVDYAKSMDDALAKIEKEFAKLASKYHYGVNESFADRIIGILQESADDER